MTRLYLLPQAFAEVEAALAEEGEVTPDLAARLDALDVELKEKLEGCCRVMRRYEAEAVAFCAEALRLEAHAKAAQNRATWMKRYIDRTLEQLGIDSINTEFFRLRRQAGSHAVVIAPGVKPGELPTWFVRTTVEPNKQALLAAFKAGEPLPDGVSVTQSKHLRIN